MGGGLTIGSVPKLSVCKLDARHTYLSVYLLMSEFFGHAPQVQVSPRED